MTTSVEAVYEGGVFRPIGQVKLTEGTRVDVRIPHPASPRDPRTVARKLANIADSTPRRGQRESTGRDHDRLLYGGDTPQSRLNGAGCCLPANWPISF